MTDDQKIWNDFKSNKDYALSHIYHHHIDLLFRYGRKFTRDDDLIKDAIQELFFDLIRSRENLGDTDNIRFYLLKSLKNKLIRILQKDQKYIHQKTENNQPEFSSVYSYEEDLIERENRERNEQLLLRGLNELSPRQREILFYRFTCELDYPEICDIMSIRYDSARKMVFRALNALRKVISSSDIMLFFLQKSIQC
ncbi:RNA polymerase sigma factor [Prolixibacter denitrificans]|uniref:DNA-directed RNA polymerase sigma-70 factor n=1 Tax=Prolixibacter denitrificans TaxID=1541063 RepID=A0A2P8CJT7_9BACT|nr:sigma-70 family RNA polymerase sigma factor [Prolixibacter denitrificans]PSK85239.1 RNA polymerase sigma factor (sigma-70 family) [Prolixibacter denitrificans]GET19861.1 DNA-directed RNA polymerase sigma-70 factor [Prolixibacter denitrificans]